MINDIIINDLVIFGKGFENKNFLTNNIEKLSDNEFDIVDSNIFGLSNMALKISILSFDFCDFKVILE